MILAEEIYQGMCYVVARDPKLLVAYKNDLNHYDRDTLFNAWERSGRLPFVWICRELGTSLTILDDLSAIRHIEMVLKNWQFQYKVAYIFDNELFEEVFLADIVERARGVVMDKILCGKEVPCQL